MLHRVVEENLRIAMRCYARVNECGEAREYPGLSVACCGLSCSVFNSALLSRPAEADDLRRVLKLASVHFRQRGFGWTFWLCEDLLSREARTDSGRIITSAGLMPLTAAPGMYAAGLAEPLRPAPAGFSIRPVDSDAARLEFSHLSSVIFHLPFPMAKSIYTSRELWQPPMRGWIGYADGQPVSTAAVVSGAGVAGLYSVGTLPAWERRGFAEALIRHAVQQSKETEGTQASVLQSSARGFGLYYRMGYRTVTRFGVYMNESWHRN